MFNNCIFESIDLSCLNTNNVTNMGGLFRSCQNLIKIKFSNFDTQNVEDMSYMFAYCKKLTDFFYLSKFKTSKVTNFSRIFNSLPLKSIDLSFMDTKNAIDMSGMFANCTNLENINLNKLDTKNCQSMESMFRGCQQLKNIKIYLL